MAQANIKAVISAEDRASGVLKGFGDRVSSLGGSILGIAKKASLALTAAGTAATVFAVKSAADFEQTRIGLENMLGSADAARAMLAKVSKFAAETPFEFPELAQATRQLVAFGFSGEDAFETMTQLGDVSAAIGAPISDLSYLMGTLRAQGRAFTIDIRQFAMRGIPIYEYLAKVFKTNTKEVTKLIEEGKVGFPQVQKAFQMMTAEGGKFHNTMAKQSKSLSGLWSTLKDIVGQTARELVGITQEGDIKEGSLFDILVRSTKWLTDNLPRAVEVAKMGLHGFMEALKGEGMTSDGFVGRMERLGVMFRQWGSIIGDVASKIAGFLMPRIQALFNSIRDSLLPALVKLWKEVLVPLVPVIGTLLVVALGLAIDAINGLVNVLGPLINWLAENKEITFGLIGAITAWYVLMKATAAFNVMFNSLALLHARLGSVMAQAGGVRASLSLLNRSLMSFTGWGIFVGAAVAAFMKIRNEAKRTIQVLDETFNKVTAANRSTDSALRKANEQFKAGKISKDRMNAILKNAYPARASGGPVSSNQPYIVGERGPELFMPKDSGTIVPNNRLSSAGTVNLNVNVGVYAGSEIEKRKIAQELMRAFNDAKSTNAMGWSS